MDDYKEDYKKIVNSKPSYEYETTEQEVQKIQKFKTVQDDDEEIHYGDVVYSSTPTLIFLK